MNKKYTDINSNVIDKWVDEGWEWGQPISHEVFEKAKNNDWFVLLTPTKPVPKDWFCDFKNADADRANDHAEQGHADSLP